jgi:hypothetical protein
MSENQGDLGIIDSDPNRYNNHTNQKNKKALLNVEKETRKIKKKKKESKIFFSMKYIIYLITLWLIFFAAFIIGFILHFDKPANQSMINASTVIWAFSSFIFVIAILYTFIYYKAKKANEAHNLEEMRKYLRFIPL